MEDLSHLNPQQIEAVTFGAGPLLIIAGAGTGKTTVITERIKHLIAKGIAKPSEILALTFTEKSATEMETRVDQALPLGASQMWVTTFHGFCDRVLRQHGFHLGYDTKYKILTTAESIDLLKRNLYELGLDYFAPLGNPTKFLFGLLTHFSRLQDENVTPQQYLQWATCFSDENRETPEDILEGKKWKELASVYQKFEALKIERSLFDFGDLITKTIQLFTDRPNVLREYQTQFKYVLVDEFQDTNYAQNQLTKLLAGSAGNITVVGDDDQSIYKFRGAAVSNMLQFRSTFPTAKVVTLIRNYRSLQNILDAAHIAISHNNPDRLEVLEKIDKKLVAERKGLGIVQFHAVSHVLDEADLVVKKILELQEQKQLRFSDFAVLVRANNHADPFIRVFESAGVPYQFLGPGKLFLESEIVDLISYLTLISDITDSAALYRVLSNPFFGISPITLLKIAATARRAHESLFEGLEKAVVEVSSSIEKVPALIEMITEHVTAARNESAGTILLDFLSRSGIKEALLKENSMEAVRSAQNIEKFFEKIKMFEALNPKATVLDVVDWIALQSEVGESPMAAEIDWESEDKVNILTVHSAKGLEFPVVFLVNLVSQRFPSTERHEQIPIPGELINEVLPVGDFHIQEERRLFYVGMTRARDELHLTAAKFYGEGKREKKVSSFVGEAIGNEVSATKSDVSLTQTDDVDTEDKNGLLVDSLSYSAIEAFKVCPLHYKLRYLLHIPTEPSASQSFGVSFHTTMKDFYDALTTGEKPSKQLLHSLLEKNWIASGYLSKEHSRKSLDKAKMFLEYYFDNWFEKQNTPLALEQKFAFQLSDLKVTGVIDRIDATEKGIHIIDYKTGSSVMTQKEADKSLQLSIYALAATKIQDPPFNRKSEQVKLSLMYFDTPLILTTYRTKTQLREAEEEILHWRNEIEKSSFECSGNFLCQTCEYKQYCKAEQI